MKNSGIEWIGEIPDDWKIVYLSSIFNEHKRKNMGLICKNLLSLSYGKIKRKDINTTDGLLPESFEGYNIIENGDIVLRLTDLQNDQKSLRTGIAHETGLITSAYITIRCLHKIALPDYMHYYLHSFDTSKGFYGMGDGVRQGLNYDGIKKILMLLPPINEQPKIADYLDKKCAAVDRLIENQRAQIEKLKGYKQSVITEAVTRGLDPSAPLKDSGIEWLGKIPTNFSIQNVRSLFQIRKEIIGREPETVLSITQSGLKIKNILENEGQMANSYANYQIVHIGDFAMNHMDLLTGGIGVSQYEGVTSPDYRVFEIKEVRYIKKYFLYVFETYYRNKIFYAFGQGAANLGRWRLPAQNFYSTFIPVPPLEEQKQIADYLDKKCAEIDKLIAIKQQKIETLAEYKKSLIYEYVTGKKQVG